jgi:ribosomal protein S12 methylthiotransferase accessory factor
MTAWYASLYTGLFRGFGSISSRPHDPRLSLCSGTAAPWSGVAQNLEASGIGWDAAMAEAACVGEAIERLQAYPLPDDQLVTASFDKWPLDEPAAPPERWVLFHREQYDQEGFPFHPFRPDTSCAWVCCRQALTGDPIWAPAELVFLNQRPEAGHCLCPGISTGLASGRTGDPILLRGLQEVIERDAVVGAWWGRYPLEEYSTTDVLAGLGNDVAERVLRPNLSYRCLRVPSPFSDHVMIVTLAGQDREGWCFSVGSACRETAAMSWTKALLEAIHGRHYVRHLKQEVAAGRLRLGPYPTTFAEHAVWYSVHPDALANTVLSGVARPEQDAKGVGRVTHLSKTQGVPPETVAILAERLGPDRPVLFRDMTPPALAAEGLGWHVLRVVVPGLQPLHGSHLLAHLGGPLWAPRGLREWLDMPPHPMP